MTVPTVLLDPGVSHTWLNTHEPYALAAPNAAMATTREPAGLAPPAVERGPADDEQRDQRYERQQPTVGDEPE